MSNLIGQLYRLNAADEQGTCEVCLDLGVWVLVYHNQAGKRVAMQSCTDDLAELLKEAAQNALGKALYKPEL